jgi:thymidylate synthase (FAD)
MSCTYSTTATCAWSNHMGSDLSIVRNARVSYDAEWRTGEDAGKDEKLIRYLWKNRHTSPFEAVQFTFDIKCPIFVARQWHRHRTWAYNEISARYAELPDEFYVPSAGPDHHAVGIQQADAHGGAARPGAVHARSRSPRAGEAGVSSSIAMLLEIGFPRELAGSVLPVATYTHFFATVDLRNLFHFLELRLHEHAQYEIRVYAEALLTLITQVVPNAMAAFQAARGAPADPASVTAGT